MGRYAAQVEHLPLFSALSERAGSDAAKLAGMVLAIADEAGPLLSRIPVIFKQYTEHDLGHSLNLIRLMGQFIPKATTRTLSDIEIAVLILSALLHDVGMYVEPHEKEQYLSSDHFLNFLASSPERQRAIEEAQTAGRTGVVRAIEDAALADYFRRHHPDRAATNIDRYFADKLLHDDFDLAPDVKRICESHGWPVFESSDPATSERTIARGLKCRAPLNGMPFNQQYIACCLRLADIMDFDRSRTPVSILRTITDARSQAEWQKHMQIRGWEIGERVVEYHAACKHPEHFVAVMEFLDVVDDELAKCRRLLVRDAPRDVAEKYMLHLPGAVDRLSVEMEDKTYAAGGFRFELEYERILTLLMDKSLYPDPTLFLRELLQNSLDACRFRKAIAESEGSDDKYEPHIIVWDKSGDSPPRIEFQDNGIGMSEDVVKGYLLRVGRSFYRSSEFNVLRQRLSQKGIQLEATSQFGIGVLSCFLVADRLDIDTYRLNEVPLHISVEGPSKYFLIRRLQPPKTHQVQSRVGTPELDGPPLHAGTRITVHLRSDVSLNVSAALDAFCSNLECDVIVVTGRERKVIKAWRWEREEISSRKSTRGYDNFAQPLPPSVADDLDRILVRSEVPLAAFGLRGRAFFWFLRGTNGKPVPTKGQLRIGTHLSPRAAVVWLTLFATDATWWNHVAKHISVPLPYVGVDRLPGKQRFVQLWNRLSRKRRLALLSWRRKAARKEIEWYEAVDASVARTDAWMSAGVRLTRFISMNQLQKLALHGIELPAGITHWDPISGSGTKVNLLDFCAGFQVDVRKDEVPIPAVNRLFMDPKEGEKVGVPLARAFLRHALFLAYSHERNRAWQSWFDEFVTSIFGSRYWPSAVWLEADALLPWLRRKLRTTERVLRVTAIGRNTLSGMPNALRVGQAVRASSHVAIVFACRRVWRENDHVFVDLNAPRAEPAEPTLHDILASYFGVRLPN